MRLDDYINLNIALRVIKAGTQRDLTAGTPITNRVSYKEVRQIAGKFGTRAELAACLGGVSEVYKDEYLYCFDIDLHGTPEEDKADALNEAEYKLFAKHKELRGKAAVATTPSGGRHYYFSTDSFKIKTNDHYLSGSDWVVELLGNGKRAILPGDGNKRRWLKEWDEFPSIPFDEIDAPVMTDYVNTDGERGHVGVSLDKLRVILDALDGQQGERKGWIRVAMGVKSEYAGTDLEEKAYEVFDEWSQRYGNYDERTNRLQWDYLRSDEDDENRPNITMRTLLADANYLGKEISEADYVDENESEEIQKEREDRAAALFRGVSDSSDTGGRGFWAGAGADGGLSGDIDGSNQSADRHLPSVFKNLSAEIAIGRSYRQDGRESLLSMGYPEQLLTVPGVLGKYVDWYNAACRVANPQLAVASAIMLGAHALGRSQVCGDNIYSSLYCIVSAPTGAGKDNVAQCIKRVLAKAGCDPDQISSSGVASAQGLRDLMSYDASNGKLLLIIDEIGEYLVGANSNPIIRSVKADLLQLWSSVASSWKAKTVATLGRDKKSRIRAIQRPALSILGMGTPQTLGGVLLDSSDVQSGFTNRFIVIDSKLPKLSHTPTASLDEPPDEVVRWVNAMLTLRAPGDEAIYDPDEPTRKQTEIDEPLHFPFAQDAATQESLDNIQALSSFYQNCKERSEIYSRQYEQTLRVAFIVARSRDGSYDCEVNADDLAWAWQFVSMSIKSLEEMTVSQHQQFVDAIVGYLSEYGDKDGASKADIINTALPLTAFSSKRSTDDFFNALAEREVIRPKQIKVEKSGREEVKTRYILGSNQMVMDSLKRVKAKLAADSNKIVEYLVDNFWDIRKPPKELPMTTMMSMTAIANGWLTEDAWFTDKFIKILEKEYRALNVVAFVRWLNNYTKRGRTPLSFDHFAVIFTKEGLLSVNKEGSVDITAKGQAFIKGFIKNYG